MKRLVTALSALSVAFSVNAQTPGEARSLSVAQTPGEARSLSEAQTPGEASSLSVAQTPGEAQTLSLAATPTDTTDTQDSDGLLWEGILQEEADTVSYTGLYEVIDTNSPHYQSLSSALTLYQDHRYLEADAVFEAGFKNLLGKDVATMEDLRDAPRSQEYGYWLYQYAYNSFFLGDEAKGMALLELSADCGYLWAIQDYETLSNCETVGMDTGGLRNSVIKQYNDYIDRLDVAFTPKAGMDSDEITRAFWDNLLSNSVEYNVLQNQLAKPKRKKTLSMAIKKVDDAEESMKNLLSQCSPREVGEIEMNLADMVVGNSTGISELRIYQETSPNAFATPYGQIYLTSGLVEQEHSNNDLLAGVCAHELTHYLCSHSLVGIWRQLQKEKKNRIIGATAAGLFAAAMTTTVIATSDDVHYHPRVFDDIAALSTLIYWGAAINAFYFQFKYSRDQELEADLAAYRFCEATGIGGYAYIMSLQLLGENELTLKAAKTDDHPSIAFRIGLLKYIHSLEN